MITREKATTLLKDVGVLINGDRAKSYGEPQESFNAIANYWSLYTGIVLTTQDVAKMMILLKICRDRNPALDNWADIIGYACLGGSAYVKDSE